jgi:flavin-dependent dehydrogenase
MTYDVLIIGAGPGGATSALLLAREGLKVLVLEKSQHPRFHIGESILPCNYPLVCEIGLENQLKTLPHLTKTGAEFGMGDDHNTTRFTFDTGLIPGSVTFNIERAHFDEMLTREARAAGAEVRENTAVKRIVELRDGHVSIELATGETVTAKLLLDASGHGTVVGRHLNIRKPVEDRNLHKVAYFNHFDHVERLPGTATGHPTIIMCDEGWFWLIGLSETKTSVGFVTHPDTIKRIGVPANRMLKWAAERCPVVRHRMRDAVGVVSNEVLADFSYTCKPIAGPGYFMVGDAGAFLDPIFSTGVTLAMKGAQQAARQAMAVLKNGKSPAVAQREYIQFVEGSTGTFWRLIRNYYRHSFRELFMEGRGPMNVHGAIISLLAGHVFPKPPFKLTWRLWFFELCVWANERWELVPRRKRVVLEQSDVVEIPCLREPAGAARREVAAGSTSSPQAGSTSSPQAGSTSSPQAAGR